MTLTESANPGSRECPQGISTLTNETKGDMKDGIAADVHVPGPYPSSEGDPTGEPLSESEPTKATRSAGSLGNLTEETSPSTTRKETGGLGSPTLDDDKQADE